MTFFFPFSSSPPVDPRHPSSFFFFSPLPFYRALRDFLKSCRHTFQVFFFSGLTPPPVHVRLMALHRGRPPLAPHHFSLLSCSCLMFNPKRGNFFLLSHSRLFRWVLVLYWFSFPGLDSPLQLSLMNANLFFHLFHFSPPHFLILLPLSLPPLGDTPTLSFPLNFPSAASAKSIFPAGLFSDYMKCVPSRPPPFPLA